MYRVYLLLFLAMPASIFALPVGLDVKIYTNPEELTRYGPDIYVLPDNIGTTEVRYYVVAENFGTTDASPCTLKVILPQPNYLVLPYDPQPVYPPDFRLVSHNDEEYIFATSNLRAGTRRLFTMNIIVDVQRLPGPVNPPNCVTLQADAFLFCPQEFESYTDNTTFCKITSDSVFSNLWITKRVIDGDCATERITYTIEYGNNGTEPVDSAEVWDILPEGSTLTGSSIPPDLFLGGRLIWELPRLLPSSSGMIDLTISISGSPRPALFTNTARIYSPGAESTLADNSISVDFFCPDTQTSCFDLKSEVHLVSSNNVLFPDSSMSYIVIVSNIGSREANNVTITINHSPSSIFGSPQTLNLAVSSIPPGGDTTFTITAPQVSSTCQPQYNEAWVVVNVKPGVGDCDSSNNNSILRVPYRCISECDKRQVRATTRIITPNGDGYNDVAFFFPNGDVKIKIFNTQGVLVRTLYGTQGWDGKDDSGEELEPGVYIWQIFCPASESSPLYSGTIAIKR